MNLPPKNYLYTRDSSLEYLSECGSKLSLISATGLRSQTSLPRTENLSQPHAPAAAFQIKPVATPAIVSSAHPHL